MQERIITGIAVAIALSVAAVFFASAFPFVISNESVREDDSIDGVVEQRAVSNLQKSFEDGVHRVTGMVVLPTPCHGLSHEVMIHRNEPDAVHVRLQTLSPPPGVLCTQVLTAASFSATFPARQNATIAVLLDGEPIAASVASSGAQQ